MRHNSSIAFELKFYILSIKGANESTNFAKFHVSSQKSEILRFDVLMGFFCPNHKTFQTKNTEELSLITLKSDTKFK